MTTVLYLQNALNPLATQVIETKGREIRDLAPKDWAHPFVAFLDGQPVLRANWELVPESNQSLAFVDVNAIPMGGGGGGQSDPMRTLAMIAVVYFTAGMGGALLGIEGAAANSAVTMLGLALVNAVMPPPKPPSTQQAAALAAPSPTYSIGAQGNSGRLESAIPEHFGRLQCYPDFAAQPYQEFSGNEQYLYELLCIGRGEYDLEQIRIEDTPISSFPEITYEVIPPNGTLNLFPANVVSSVEVSGADLVTGTWFGPFTANPSGSTANYIGLDFVAPRGLYYAQDSGELASVSTSLTVQARTVDEVGTPTGSWVTIASPTYTAATTTPQRYSEKISVTPGRYEVRVQRTDTEQTSGRYGHDIAWAGMRAYLTDSRTFGDVTLIALRMRATNSLSSQSSRKLNIICTRKLPVWTGTVWSPNTPTRSIAWALVYVCRQLGLSDAQIDINTLISLNSVWTSRGDRFDARFDNFLGAWEALTKIAGAGRAKPFMQGGVVRFKRDQQATLPVAFFSMRNIVKGSFTVDYLMPTVDTADAVDVNYFDENSWKPSKVRAALPGSTSAKPAKVDLFGVTGRDQAFREGMYQAASNRYRRKIIKFSTEMEGFIPAYGDLISIQHDMPAWGQGGEVVSVESSQNLLQYSEQLNSTTWTKAMYAVQTNVAAAPDGTMTAEKLVAYTGSGLNQLIPATAPTFTATQCASAYFKAAGMSVASILFSTTGLQGATFNLSTGVATATDSQNLAAMANVGNGWWHCWVWRNNGVAAANIAFGPGVGAVAAVTGNSADGVYAWGLELKEGSEPGPYVQTLGSAKANVTVLNLSEPLAWDTGTHYIALRKRDGGLDGPFVATPGLNANQIVMGSEPSFTPYTGQSEERTHYTFGWADTWRQPAIVLSARPRDLFRVDIEAVAEDNNVHTAEVGVTTPQAPTSQLAGYTSAPVVKGLTARFQFNATTRAVLAWQPAPWADHYNVEITQGDGNWTRLAEPRSAGCIIDVPMGGASTVRVSAVGSSQGPWAEALVLDVAPFTPGTVSYSIEKFGIRIQWPEMPEVDTFELRVGGTDWGSASPIATVVGVEYLWNVQTAGNLTLRVKARGARGTLSLTDSTVLAVVTLPDAPSVSRTLTGVDELLTWSIPASGFLVDRYEIRYGANWASGTFVDTTKATGYRARVDYVGARTWWVAAIDAAGNVGTAGSVSVTIVAPGAVQGMRTEVVDNNALVYWNEPVTGTLPIDRYEARKGLSWASGTVIGSNGNSTFTTVFEQLAGNYTYWVSAVDSAGNFGPPANITAFINQPPDYILRTDANGLFNGSTSNALPDSGSLILPLNATESWQQHFANNGWATPQAQVAAGYPIYIDPTVLTSVCVHDIDYGSVLPATTITATPSSQIVRGAVTSSCQIQYKLNAGDAWTNAPAGATSAMASNFRYVRITFTFTGDGTGRSLLRLTNLNTKLSVKQRGDSGVGSAAVGGTFVPFGYAFASADLPQVQPAGSTPLIPVVIYAGGPNPTGFTVKLFNLSGTDVGGSFSWSVKGY